MSKTREAPPLANENPAVPGPSDEALYDAAANPDACQARGVGEGDGVGDAAGDAAAAGAGEGVICASAGTALRTHAAVKAATSVFKTFPNEGW